MKTRTWTGAIVAMALLAGAVQAAGWLGGGGGNSGGGWGGRAASAAKGLAANAASAARDYAGKAAESVTHGVQRAASKAPRGPQVLPPTAPPNPLPRVQFGMDGSTGRPSLTLVPPGQVPPLTITIRPETAARARDLAAQTFARGRAQAQQFAERHLQNMDASVSLSGGIGGVSGQLGVGTQGVTTGVSVGNAISVGRSVTRCWDGTRITTTHISGTIGNGTVITGCTGISRDDRGNMYREVGGGIGIGFGTEGCGGAITVEGSQSTPIQGR
jgi:hypothetical protein